MGLDHESKDHTAKIRQMRKQRIREQREEAGHGSKAIDVNRADPKAHHGPVSGR